MSQPLVLEHVVKQFGDQKAVDGVSLVVEQGEIYGLLGANGAGKTTTMRMVLGVIFPDAGRISYFGAPYGPAQRHDMGYLPEERGLYPKIKVSEQLIYLAQLRGMTAPSADKSLRMWLERFEVPEYYDKRVEELSKGNQQKIGFIASVIHDPKILILDEAFSGLDPVNVELLKQNVKQLRDQGTSILFSTHRMEHVEELCRNIAIMHRGKPILQGSLDDIKGRYPREEVVLSTTGQVTGLEQIVGVTSVQRQQRGYVITISDQAAARYILEAGMTQSEVLHFEIKEPTLNQIFIREVGESHE